MIDIGSIENEIRRANAKRILIQSPEGLKTRIQEMARHIESSLSIDTLISCDPTYGACDLRDKEAKALGCDLLLHIGHTDFGVKPALPVIYLPYPIDFDPLPLLKKHIDELEPYKKICAFTTSQFLHCLEKAKSFLEASGKEVFIGKHHRAGTQGQALGCDYSSALPFEKQADCFLYLGTGLFHPLGLALRTEKPVFSLDFETQKLVNMEKEKRRLERIKAYHIGQAKEARKFGILVSTKEGQLFLGMAERIKKKLQAAGKHVWIVVSDEVTPAKLMGMEFDVLVNCACPRIDEDFELFKKPILNPADIDKI